VEVLPGFVTPFEFQLVSNAENNNWTGNFYMAELMSKGQFSFVTVTDSLIRIDLGEGFILNGTISNNRKEFLGYFKMPDRDPLKVRFERNDTWSSNGPARTNANGRPDRDWKYIVPETTDDGWEVSSINVSRKEFGELLQSTIRGTDFKGLDALLVAQNGKLVLEEYFHLGSRERIHSIQSDTKSVTSLLFGKALERRQIAGLDIPLQSFFPQYVDSMKAPKWNVTLKDALMMAASLQWNEHNIPYSDPTNDAVLMNGSKDMYYFVLSHQPKVNEEPGTSFAYNSGLSVLLGGVLKHATGKSVEQHAKEVLFDPLGIGDFYWISLRGQTHTGGGLYLRPRDLLKIGQLVLDSGRWKGRQIVPEKWINESTSFLLPTSNPGEGYGYQWWRGSFRNGQSDYPYIFASGYGGQFLWIVPDLKLVALALHHIPMEESDSRVVSPKEMQDIILPQFAGY
jgi:CubicO group peptidase (beta-lactamase class C family)